MPIARLCGTPLQRRSQSAVAAASDLAGLTGIRLGLARAALQRAGVKLDGGSAAAAPSKPSAPQAAAPAAPPSKPTVAPASATGRGDRRVPMSVVRKMTAKRLKETANTAALLTTFQEVDLTTALEVRSRYKDSFQKKHGCSFGLLSLFVKASCMSLTEIPGVNAIIDDAAGEIVYRDFADISVPIPTPRGVASCTLPSAEAMSIAELEGAIAGVAAKARRDALTPEDTSAATFGIIDGGSAGSMLGTQIINPSTSAVLGTNAVKRRAAVVDGKVVPRSMMYLSLTYDHRIIDGREAVTFLVSIRDKMEDPVRMLIDI